MLVSERMKSTVKGPAKPGLWLHAWDFLVWALVIFPLITGGLWIRKPGLKIELAELAVPVIAVAALGALLSWLARVPLGEAASVRLALELWRRWERCLERRPRTALWSGSAVVAAVWALASLRRHWTLGSGAADLGIFTSAI